MQSIPRLRALILSQPAPVGAPRLPRRDGTCAGCHPMQDRSEQVLVDDVVVGRHGGQPLSFSRTKLSPRARPDYVEKSEIVQ